jgi:hypothetical protein
VTTLIVSPTFTSQMQSQPQSQEMPKMQQQNQPPDGDSSSCPSFSSAGNEWAARFIRRAFIVIAATAIAGMILSAVPVTADIIDNIKYDPVGLWSFQDGAPRDLINGNDGSSHGKVEYGTFYGESGAKFKSANPNDYVEVPHNDAYLIDTGMLTLRFYNTGKYNHREGLVSKDARNWVTGGHLTAYLEKDNGKGNTGKLNVRLQSTSKSYTLQSPSLALDTWYDVSFRWGEGGMKLYIDNVLVDSNAYTGGLGITSGGAGNYEPLAFGTNAWKSKTGRVTPTESGYSGVIGEVGLYYGEMIPVPSTAFLMMLGMAGGSGVFARQGRRRRD